MDSLGFITPLDALQVISETSYATNHLTVTGNKQNQTTTKL